MRYKHVYKAVSHENTIADTVQGQNTDNEQEQSARLKMFPPTFVKF